MKSGTCVGIDAVALAHLGRADARHLARAHRIEDRRALGRELERVAVAARDQHGAAAPLFGRDRGGKEIVGLVAGAFGIRETAGGDEFRQHSSCSSSASSNSRPL